MHVNDVIYTLGQSLKSRLAQTCVIFKSLFMNLVIFLQKSSVDKFSKCTGMQWHKLKHCVKFNPGLGL
jgi:hypothetical protein